MPGLRELRRQLLEKQAGLHKPKLDDAADLAGDIDATRNGERKFGKTGPEITRDQPLRSDSDSEEAREAGDFAPDGLGDEASDAGSEPSAATARSANPETAAGSEAVSFNGGVSRAATTAGLGDFAAGVEKMTQQSQAVASEIVGQIFDATRALREKLAPFGRAAEETERFGQSALAGIESVRTLEGNLLKVAEAFAPLKSLQERLGEISGNFEPMKDLENLFALVSKAFRENLLQLVNSLEPVDQIQTRMSRMAEALMPASAMRTRLRDLLRSFEQQPGAAGEKGNQNGAHANSAAS